MYVRVFYDGERHFSHFILSFCKPVVTTAFGIVTLRNVPFFVPFNSSQAPYFDYKPIEKRAPKPPNFGVTDEERNQMYSDWVTGTVLFNNAGVMLNRYFSRLGCWYSNAASDETVQFEEPVTRNGVLSSMSYIS